MNYYPTNFGTSQYMPNYFQQPQYSTINGKIVDSIETCRAQEVPLGGYGIFPKADLSEIYVKNWGIDGLTQIFTYERKLPENTERQIDEKETLVQNIDFSEVLDAISNLNKKIDLLSKQSPTSMKKTGGSKNE